MKMYFTRYERPAARRPTTLTRTTFCSGRGVPSNSTLECDTK
ncbi:hypothetical protein GQ600_8962 [Phytophthora cactorum]|nr:hypothetical protein GQ600_8962 [Phytophthora cactorum]